MTTPGAWRPQLRRLDGSSTYRPNAANAINRLTSFPVSPSFTSTSAFPAQTTSPIANGHPATPVSFADYRGNGYQPSLIHNATTSWSMEEDELPASTSVAAELPDIKPSVAPKPLSPPAGTCTEQEFVISGVRVKFPFKPYSSQTALMEKVIRCLKSKTNGLLESPTGSGKSLSLLCSSLAWQKSQHAERRAVDGITAPTAPGTKKRNEKQAMRRAPVPPVKKTGPCDCRRSPAATSAVGSDAPVLPPDDLMSEDEDNMSFDDLMNPKASAKRQRTQRGTTGGVLRDTSLANRPTPLPSLPTAPGKCSCSSATQLEQQQPSECQGPPSTEVLQQQEDVPKIYFGSRTHKQITQLVRELRKVPSYSDTKMTILGSKDQYCVHPSVSRERNKNEACQELLDSNKTAGEYFAGHQKGCEYHGGVAPSLPRLFQKGPKGRLPSIFDIEDLMESGKKNVYCPYFMSRELTENAHLIFCPYNYLVDARIRQALKISLEGQIVIFDEGHNMEDAAREAASFTLSSRELKEVLEDMSTVLALNARHRVFSPVTNEIQSVMERLRVLLEWLESNGRNVQADSFGTGNKELSGQDLVAILTEVGLGPDEYKHLEAEYEAIQADKTENEQGGLAAMQIIFDEAGNNQSKTKKVSAVTLNLVRSLVVILDYLYRLGRRHVRDYKGLLAKEMVRNNAYKVDQDNYRRKRKGHEVQEWSFKLHFWCLNPAVAFGDFHQTHSVILTSGTLSPMTSFQSELDMPFKIQFEASHVINMRQVWAGAVGSGPARTQLMGTYNHVQTLAYQDEIGQAVLSVCTIVPHGVLCFFTSYNIMDTLMKRWTDTGVMDKLEERKMVVQEPRGGGGDKAIFQKVMDDFYVAISGEGCSGRQDGAIMFAVFRGKISEGLDFADNNARAVITVGIPFPNFKDPQVTMKRLYNDQNQHRGLLSGSNWYDIQAFRALNQALGRCIRHKDDWGALVLLDSRFTFPQGTGAKSRFAQGLSKWLRPPDGLISHGSFQGAMASLKYFIQGRLALQPSSASPEEPSALLSPGDEPGIVRLEDPMNGDDFFCDDL